MHVLPSPLLVLILLDDEVPNTTLLATVSRCLASVPHAAASRPQRHGQVNQVPRAGSSRRAWEPSETASALLGDFDRGQFPRKGQQQRALYSPAEV